MVSFDEGSGDTVESVFFFRFGGFVGRSNRFVRQLRPQLPDTLKFLDRVAVQALDLGLVAAASAG
jgi:hypothetical protein